MVGRVMFCRLGGSLVLNVCVVFSDFPCLLSAFLQSLSCVSPCSYFPQSHFTYLKFFLPLSHHLDWFLLCLVPQVFPLPLITSCIYLASIAVQTLVSVCHSCVHSLMCFMLLVKSMDVATFVHELLN